MRDTRGELLLQAEILVRRRGYSGFSYADLAEAVGIRKASIHHHFRTKEDLGAALIAAYDARYEAALASIRAEQADAVARVEAYGRLYLAGVEDGLGCLCAALAVEADALPERLRGDIARFFDRHVAWLERVLEEGLAAGCVRPDLKSGASARMIVAALEGALLLERLLDGTRGFESALSALLDGLRHPGTQAPSRPSIRLL